MNIGTRVRQRLLDAGLGRVTEQLISVAQPALRLRAERAEEPVLGLGRSKIGGRPDVPEQFEWPTWRGAPLSFLGQIDLSETGALPCCGALPSTGRLLFFYDAQQHTWGFDPDDRGSFAVIHFDTPAGGLLHHDWPDRLPDEARFGACAVSFSEVLTLPPWESIFVEQLGMSDDEIDRYVDVLDQLERGESHGMLHQLLGHASPIQRDMQLECQLVANGIDVGGPEGYEDPRRAELEPGALSWRLLFQLDSEESAGMMWGDLGRLYFWIRDEDLANRRFDQAWMILQCA